jgi:hypothetical protein
MTIAPAKALSASLWHPARRSSRAHIKGNIAIPTISAAIP